MYVQLTLLGNCIDKFSPVREDWEKITAYLGFMLERFSLG